MLAISRTVRGVLILAAIAAACPNGWTQAYKVRPLAPRPNPQLISSGSLTVSAAPSSVNFSLVSSGTAQGSSGVTITTSWNVHASGTTTLNLYGYFSSSSAALSDGNSPPDVIPSSAVLGKVTTGTPTTFTSFTQTIPFGGAGAGLTLVTKTQSAASGSRTDVLDLEINLSNLPNLPAGTYNGTLTLQATMN